MQALERGLKRRVINFSKQSVLGQFLAIHTAAAADLLWQTVPTLHCGPTVGRVFRGAAPERELLPVFLGSCALVLGTRFCLMVVTAAGLWGLDKRLQGAGPHSWGWLHGWFVHRVWLFRCLWWAAAPLLLPIFPEYSWAQGHELWTLHDYEDSSPNKGQGIIMNLTVKSGLWSSSCAGN